MQILKQHGVVLHICEGNFCPASTWKNTGTITIFLSKQMELKNAFIVSDFIHINMYKPFLFTSFEKHFFFLKLSEK